MKAPDTNSQCRADLSRELVYVLVFLSLYGCGVPIHRAVILSEDDAKVQPFLKPHKHFNISEDDFNNLPLVSSDLRNVN